MSLMWPYELTVEVPAVAPSRIRKTTEKAIVMSAPIGFSQNDSCSKPHLARHQGQVAEPAERSLLRDLQRAGALGRVRHASDLVSPR